jgi:hypothetical protein
MGAVHTKGVTVQPRRLLRHQLDDVELFLGDTGGVPSAAEPTVVVGVGAVDTDALELVMSNEFYLFDTGLVVIEAPGRAVGA